MEGDVTEISTIDRAADVPKPIAPPLVTLPKLAQGIAFVASRRWTTSRLAKKYGKVYTINIPKFGYTVVVADPDLTREVFTTSTEILGNIQPNLSQQLGPGSVFALERNEHRHRRKLLAPKFHGKAMVQYEQIIEEETLRECATWPEGQQFETMEPMMRITLNAILRAVFGADGAELDVLRRLIPPWVVLASLTTRIPQPKRNYGRFSPWGRLKTYRAHYDAVIGSLIEKALAAPDFEDRTDILALLLRSTYDDGTTMSRSDVSDELLTLLAAGHETTATTLAWAFERITRHPEVLSRLAAEAQGDSNEYRQATILEVQRSRPVIDFAGRHVLAPHVDIGPYRIPQGHSVVVSINLMHDDPMAFPCPERFDPERFMGAKPGNSWVPYGGGTRRCVGAAFANMEMDIVLRTVLRHFTIETTTAPDEKWHSRGVASCPKNNGRVTVRRR
ncbi:cytochrome P450 [Mycobacteroides abscessus subsp. abscessus]|uniref:cytochrome P450 n=1 Tax=Mycobacteroides abscessus TaxID=36809 RepID=UPI000940693C|nr:cytochrome P450 [Mycobacteroides abscessus]AWG51906.1 cytochrome P450 [Mycobacteroides abscessus]MBN7438489.1 cytochrome P450 [Mycobacteroides abscessus subsp. abscessus]MBN7558915.1 cytochrome P450 [Mycobacteroides abscessus subsp. abscessus]MDO3100032.1 cytochrome P450 [Mycobacteroides abscessus subsp. abscessus]MDO3187124.1 cytochrome P450 [Mycobacteroides abscessus subsp. abscessus]